MLIHSQIEPSILKLLPTEILRKCDKSGTKLRLTDVPFLRDHLYYTFVISNEMSILEICKYIVIDPIQKGQYLCTGNLNNWHEALSNYHEQTILDQLIMIDKDLFRDIYNERRKNQI
jgi:hypothetical protein